MRYLGKIANKHKKNTSDFLYTLRKFFRQINISRKIFMKKNMI